MPALQVKDFPAGLYENLKDCAGYNRRSISQQTIFFVEQGLANPSTTQDSGATSPAPDSERAARIKKRRALFAEIDASPVRIANDFLNPADVVREARDERERELDARCGFPGPTLGADPQKEPTTDTRVPTQGESV